MPILYPYSTHIGGRNVVPVYNPPTWANWLLISGYGFPEPEAGISRSTATHVLLFLLTLMLKVWVERVSKIFMTVYKYYPNNRYTIDALLKNYFFFSKVSKLNDPYDTSFRLIQSPQYIEALLKKGMHPLAEDIMRNYGTCSFTRQNDSKHMWAFYANNYKGLVVGFDEKYLQKLSQVFLANIPYVKVAYTNETPSTDKRDAVFKPLYIQEELKLGSPIKFTDALTDPKKREHLFVYLCSLKEERTWGEEEERRLIVAGQIIKPEAQRRLKNRHIGYLPNGYAIPFPKESVKEIIWGHNCTLTNKIKKRIIRKYGNAEIEQTSCQTPFTIDIIPFNKKF